MPAIRSKAVVPLLLIHYLLLLQACDWVLCLVFVFNLVLNVHSHIARILPRKRELDILLKLCYCCHVTASVLCRFKVSPCVGLCSVNVAFCGNTRMFFTCFRIVIFKDKHLFIPNHIDTNTYT